MSGVGVNGAWTGTCCFADDTFLPGESEGELESMLNVVSGYASRWKLRFSASKRGVLVVGNKKSGKIWRWVMKR